MHGTKDLEIHELHEGHAAVIILVMGADQADRELDLDLSSNGKFASFDKLYPPTSNRQAAITGTNGVAPIDLQSFLPRDEGYFALCSAEWDLTCDPLRQFLNESKIYPTINESNTLNHVKH